MVLWPIRARVLFELFCKFLLCTLMTSQTNPSRKQIFYLVENVIKQLVHASAVRSSRYEALGKFGEHSRSQSCSQLRLEQLLHIFRALQTSRVLHISKNTHWRLKQLLAQVISESQNCVTGVVDRSFKS